MEKALIYTVCGDAGGANAVAPVLAKLKSNQALSFTSLILPYSVPAFQTYSLEYETLSSPLSEEEASSRLKELRPSLLLTGSSWGIQPEKPFIAAARKLGIRSVSILDHWSSYRLRFNDSNDKLAFLPDKIAVMDDHAKSEMLADGFPSESIVVTGGPHFESLDAERKSFTAAERKMIRASVHAGESDKLVLFVSEPVSELDSESLGYDEHTVIDALALELEKISSQKQAPIILTLKTHPRESTGKYRSRNWPRSRYFKVEHAPADQGRRWAMASDLITGMKSTILFDACYLGKLVVSYQPHLKSRDRFLMNSRGLSLGVMDPKELHSALERSLFDDTFKKAQEKKLEKLIPPRGATDRVVHLIDEILREKTK